MKGRHLALLRGVNNIGPSKRVSMADLRDLFQELGFRDVRTLLNSGNVVFSLARPTGDVAARIEAALASRLELKCAVTLLTAAEVASVVRDNPLARVANRPSQLLVMVPRTRSELVRVRPLLEQCWSPEALALGRRVAYLWCGNGVPRSPLWAAVDRALDRSGTVRNLATFIRVLASLDEPMTPNKMLERTVRHRGPRLAAARRSVVGRSTHR